MTPLRLEKKGACTFECIWQCLLAKIQKWGLINPDFYQKFLFEIYLFQVLLTGISNQFRNYKTWISQIFFTKFDVYFDSAKVIFRKRARDKSRLRKVRSNFLEKHLGFVARYKCRKNITLNHKICIIQRVLALCYFWDLEKIRISQKSH